MQSRLNIAAWVALLLGAAIVLASCAQLDEFVTPNPATGIAPIKEVGNTIVEIGQGVGLSPWAQIVAGALSLFGGGYLLFRKIQKVRAK